MKRYPIICKNPNCRDEIKEYKSRKREFCSLQCKNSYNYYKKQEEQEDSIMNAKAINRLKRVLKEIYDMEIESITYKEDSYFFNNIVLPSTQTFIDDKGKEYLVSRLDEILIHRIKNSSTIKIFKYERINKTLL
jgi:hypothetical protein